ncbi:hypothetical protein D3C75_1234850 [compost metagenome]
MADVHESDRAFDYASHLLQLHHADHAGVPGVYRTVHHHRWRPDSLHLLVLALHLRHSVQILRYGLWRSTGVGTVPGRGGLCLHRL